MSGNATGINFGDEQDWREKVFENQLEKRQVLGFEILPQSSERTCSQSLGRMIAF
jgi:hypothetical protein